MKLFRNFLIYIFIALSLQLTADDGKIQKKKIGLCIMATGKYDKYAITLIDSGRKYFCKDHDVTYFVFTDQNFPKSSDVVITYQKRLGWPHDTLKRFHVYYENKELYKNIDYLFACDADMLFAAPIGDEIFGKLVGTQHPGFVGKRGSYETDKKSTAYVSSKEGKYYFCGGFYGGEKQVLLSLWETVIDQIQQDFKKDYIAVWHDESHLNRYFIDHPPSKMLSPSYCYPESWKLPYEKKLLALDKNHDEMRK